MTRLKFLVPVLTGLIILALLGLLRAPAPHAPGVASIVLPPPPPEPPATPSNPGTAPASGIALPPSPPVPQAPPPDALAASPGSPAPSATPPNSGTPTPTPAPPPAPAATPAPAPAPVLAPLPEKTIAEHVVHTVPDPGPPPGGHPLDLRNFEGAGAAPVTAPAQFSGTAQVTGPTRLAVGAIAVQLFGVKPASPGDRCRGSLGEMACTESARQALSLRLGGAGTVHCRTPVVQPGRAEAAAICLDASGIDLGGYLVGEGLARADTNQSYDYVGAESVAHSLKRGLWQGR